MIGALACRYLGTRGTSPAYLLGTLLVAALIGKGRNKQGQAGLPLAPNIEDLCASASLSVQSPTLPGP